MPLSQNRPWIIAHRGVPCEAPENTLSGFELAISQGADLIEIDLHLSADRQLVVIHDDTVDRTTDGTGRIGDLSFNELRALDAGSWMGSLFSGERIPILSDVLELSADRVGIVVELKHGSDRYPGIEPMLVHEIKSSQRLHDVIVISRNRAAINTINAANPDIMTLDFGHLLTGSSKWMKRKPLSRPGKRFLFAKASEVEVERIKHLHDLGYRVLCSLIKEELSQQVLRKLLAASIDGIFTDHVTELKQALNRC